MCGVADICPKRWSEKKLAENRQKRKHRVTASSDVRQYLRQCLFPTKPGSLCCTVHLRSSLSTAANFATENFGPFLSLATKCASVHFANVLPMEAYPREYGSYTLCKDSALFSRASATSPSRGLRSPTLSSSRHAILRLQHFALVSTRLSAPVHARRGHACTAHPKRGLFEGPLEKRAAGMNGLDPLFAAAHFDALLSGHGQSQGEAGAPQLSAFSQDELSWLEQQLSFASPPSHPTLPATSNSSTTTTTSSSGNGTPASTVIPLQPHAFPPVSQARFHPYQLPPERAQRVLRPPGPHAQLNLLSSAAQLQQLALEQQQQQRQQSSVSNGLAVPGYQPNGNIDGIDWAAFGSFGSVPTSPFSVPSAAAAAPHPPQSYQQQVQHQQQLALSFGNSAAAVSPRQSRPRPSAPHRQTSTTSSTSTHSNSYEVPHRVLYPPANSPPTVLLPDLPTPPLPPAPHASPATPRTNYSASSPAAGASGLANEVSMRDGDSTISGVPKRKRARSAPPPPRVRQSVNPPGAESRDDAGGALETRSEQLDALFTWLDDQRWSFSTLFTALSEVSPAESDSPRVALSHRRRMEDFLAIDEPLFSSATAATASASKQGTDLGLRLLREARKRWSERAADGGDGTMAEKGPNEVVRMWEEMGALGRGEGSMVRVSLAVI